MSNQIKNLTEREHFRTRETSTGEKISPLQSVTEALDNCFDELYNSYADTVYFKVVKDGHYILYDNGRGIPIHNVEIKDELKGTSVFIDSIVAAFAKSNTGSKFDDDTTSEIRLGQNGHGLKVINFLSKFVICKLRYKNNLNEVHYYKFNDGLPEIINKSEIYDLKDGNYSTYLEFEADEKFYKQLTINQNVIKNRLILAKHRFPNSKIFFNDLEIPKTNINDFLKSYFKINNNTNIYNMNLRNGTDDLSIYFAFTDDGNDVDVLNEVNLKICSANYIQIIQNNIVNCIYEILGNNELDKRLLTKGLKIFTSLKSLVPKFSGQTKDNFIKDISFLINNSTKELKSILSSDKKLISYFNELLESLQIKKIKKKTGIKKKTISIENKLVDAICIRDRKLGNNLYMTEGESATVKDVIDNYFNGWLPVKGKIPNVYSKNIISILGSEKIKFLFEAVGINPETVGINKNLKNSYRYNKYIILCDADCDGYHISVLLSLFFYKFAPDLISEGRVSIFLPPLYKVSKGNISKFVYLESEKSKYSEQGYIISRFKGLGEMTSNDLRDIVNNNSESREIVLTIEKDEMICDKIKETLSSKCPESKKQICNDPEKYSFEQMFKLLINKV